eukprot:2610153-Amphidinium_carterae.1
MELCRSSFSGQWAFTCWALESERLGICVNRTCKACLPMLWGLAAGKYMLEPYVASTKKCALYFDQTL